jgi:hypothetical protein
MPLISNKLQKQVDLPVFEWGRPLPIASVTGLSCTCTADNPLYNETSGRYIYALLNATNFWRHDTYTDTYQQLASPGITPALPAPSMRFSGAIGYHGKVISAGPNTIQTGLPFSRNAVGYRIKIVTGKGAGQTRLITAVADPVVADFGGATAGAATTLTDANKNWGGVGATNNFNGWVGYVARIVGGTGLGQVRKILYNNATVLTIAAPDLYSQDPFALPMSPTAGTAGWTAPGAGSLYQIESSVITVDTNWDVEPDSTSRYVIQSGGIYLASGATVAAGGVTLQYYSVLEDIWYAKSVNNGMIPIVSTEVSLERLTENSAVAYSGVATSGTPTTIGDSSANWAPNSLVGYYAFVWTGTGRNSLAKIISHTNNTLTFGGGELSATPDTTTRFDIYDYDGGTLSAGSATGGRIVFDTTKTWPVDRWANFAVRILAGTGAGQIRQIKNNGSNSLVLYEPWNVQPDSTSKYIIVPWPLDLYITLGGNAETYLYRMGDADMISHGRILDEGINQIACAIPTDGTSNATHEILDVRPIALANIGGTTTITATTTTAHQLKANQWVSIRGVTSAADAANVTGKVQISSVPSATTFTYTPFAPGSGTYQYSSGVVLAVSALIDAAKYHADRATGGSTTTATFTRAQPSNINGWYVYGTNIGAGAQVVSGAGNTTVTLSVTGAGTPSGTIVFTKWPLPVQIPYSTGGAANNFTATMTATVPAYVKGWLVTGTNIGVGAYVTGGENTTTIFLSNQNTGTPAGNLTFGHPVNLPIPVSSAYSSNTVNTITFAANTESYITGWSLSGTNIPNGTIVTSGAGTATITLSTPLSATPTGNITFFAPTQAGAMFYGTTTAPVVAATGLLSPSNIAQLVNQNANNGTILTPITAITAPTAGISKYVIAQKNMIGQAYTGQNLNYLSGVAVGAQSTNSLIDGNSFWTGASGTGSAGSTNITLNLVGSPLHNGWFIAGANIAPGTRIVSGAGTTALVMDTPANGSVTGTMTITAWSPRALDGRRLRVISSTGANQELPITSVTPSSGTIGFATATAAASGTSAYTILPSIVPGAGASLQWISSSSIPNNSGKLLFRFRGGAATGVDSIDITNDRLTIQNIVPFFEPLGSGSMYAYDQLDRIYFTKDITNRLYYLDVNTLTVHGAGLFPYLAGTAGLGNKMEVFVTRDGLKYLWINRQQQVETFRQLLFF